jgi:hypothetical protein
MIGSASAMFVSMAGGVLAAALVPVAPAVPPRTGIDCPGCQVTDNPSSNPGGGIVLDFTFVSKTAGTCVENTETEGDANDCKSASTCKVQGTLSVTNNNADPPTWQLNTPAGSVSLPGGGAVTPVVLNVQFACGGNGSFSVTRSSGNPPGSVADWSWSCPACPLDAEQGSGG